LNIFGGDYDKTLMAWHQNFEDHWLEIATNYDHRFIECGNFT